MRNIHNLIKVSPPSNGCDNSRKFGEIAGYEEQEAADWRMKETKRGNKRGQKRISGVVT